MRAIISLSLVILASSAIAAQTAFEVATIKPTDPDYQGGVIDRPPGGRLSSRGIPLKYLLAIAYDVNIHQILGGPSWLESDRYDVVGKAAGTKGSLRMDEARPMLRDLFAERLKLVVVRNRKEMPVYVLTIGKNGHKLRQRDDDTGTSDLVIDPGARLPARHATMVEFSFLLQSGVLDRPVLDKTGLGGRYDFDLTWYENGRGDSNFPNLFTAVQEQLGLKLEPQTALADVIVIEHVERPSEN
jgi:bla regulator protein blaR1